MNDNPYETPTADLEVAETHTKANVWWKVWFYLNAVFLGVIVLGSPFVEFSPFDFVDLLFTSLGIVGLFGFAFDKPIGSVRIWQWFFYLRLLEMIAYNVGFPIFGVEQYGTPSVVDASLLINACYSYLFLLPLYYYAFKRPLLWSNPTT